MIIEKYVKMGERGQVVIPKEIREKEGLHPESQLKLMEIDGNIILKVERQERSPEERILEILVKAKFTDADLQEIRKKRE